MPLQKSPPKSRRIADLKARADKHTLKQRRKTLQTISELAPSQGDTQGFAGNSSRLSNDGCIYNDSREAAPRSSRNSRRRSLPIQSSVIKRDYANTSTNSTNLTAGPTLHRSLTDPDNGRGNSRNNPRRRSMPSGFDTRGRSLSPVAEGEHTRQPMPQDGPQPLDVQPNRNRSRKNQPGSISHEKEQPGGGWNARRQRELIKREQALMEANARRERERLGLPVGSSAAVPSLTPYPIFGGDESVAKQSRYYSQLSSPHQLANIPPGRQNSHGRNERQVHGSIIDGRMFLDVEASHVNSTPVQYAGGLRRSLSETSTPRFLPHTDFLARTLSPTFGSSSSSSATERHLADPRSSSSLQTSSTSTRSSSTKSSTSNTTRPSQRSSLSYPRASDHPLRQNPITSVSDFDHALAQSKLGSAFTSLPPSHAFLGPQLIPQTLSLTNPNLNPAPTTTPTPAVTPQRSRSTSSWSHSGASSTHMQMTDPKDLIYRENPDKRNLAVTDGGISGRKAEREVVEKRVARERVRERVRRANEMEERKERELVRERKGKREKEPRGWLCGLFGRGGV